LLVCICNQEILFEKKRWWFGEAIKYTKVYQKGVVYHSGVDDCTWGLIWFLFHLLSCANKIYTPLLQRLAHRSYSERCCPFKMGNEQAAKHRPWLVLWLHRLINFANCYTFLNTLLVEYISSATSSSSVTDSNLILQNMGSVLYTTYSTTKERPTL